MSLIIKCTKKALRRERSREEGEKMVQKNLLSGVIELHVHPYPDRQLRKSTDLELAAQMKSAGARAVVFKSHNFPTVGRAYTTSAAVSFPVYGSITLNEEIGGWNPAAVEAALEMGAKTVWMPTKSAENHRRYFGKAGGLSALCKDHVRDELDEILKMIAKKDVILSMGHLSVKEQMTVIPRARELGVKKIVIDHPELPIVGMTSKIQKELQRYGVYFLRCAIYLDLSRTYDEVLDNLRLLGCSDTVLSTDGGDIGLPDWPELMGEYLEYLLGHGVTETELRMMTVENPGWLLDLM